MKRKKSTYKGVTVKKVTRYSTHEDNSGVIETLKSAWNRLPSDFTSDERFIFLEIAEKVIRLQAKFEIVTCGKNSSRKN